MPLAVHDSILDKGLEELRLKAKKIHACTSQPANFAGVAAVSVGVVATTNGAVTDRTPDGRQIVLTPATGGTYTAAGTVSHYAIVDDTASLLLIADAVAVAKAVNSGDPIQLGTLTVSLPDFIVVA